MAKRTRAIICSFQETDLRKKDTHTFFFPLLLFLFHEISHKRDISCKWKGKKAGVTVHISYKIDFKTKAIVRDKEEHYIMIKGTIQQEDITLVNIYATNT